MVKYCRGRRIPWLVLATFFHGIEFLRDILKEVLPRFKRFVPDMMD